MNDRKDHGFEAALGEALRALPLERPPQSAWPRLARELAPRRRRPRMPTLLALAATLVVAATLAFVLGRGDAPSPSTSTPSSPPAVAAAQAPSTEDPVAALAAESAQIEALLDALASPGVSSASHAALQLGYTRRMQLIDQLLARPGLEDIDRLALWQERVGLQRQRLALETGEQHLAARGGEGAALLLTL